MTDLSYSAKKRLRRKRKQPSAVLYVKPTDSSTRTSAKEAMSLGDKSEKLDREIERLKDHQRVRCEQKFALEREVQKLTLKSKRLDGICDAMMEADRKATWFKGSYSRRTEGVAFDAGYAHMDLDAATKELIDFKM